MRYSKAQIQNLKKIYESKTESLNAKEFVDENGEVLEDSTTIINELLTLDLIETEDKDNRYYLTYEAYNDVECFDQNDVPFYEESFDYELENLPEELNTYSIRKQTNLFLFGLMLFGAINLTIIKYYFPPEPEQKYQLKNIQIAVPTHNQDRDITKYNQNLKGN